jgi:hypothetical protein
MPDPLIGLRLDAEDLALLEACCTKEKLTKSDVLRRALRAYAESIGATPEKRPRPKPKRK